MLLVNLYYSMQNQQTFNFRNFTVEKYLGKFNETNFSQPSLLFSLVTKNKKASQKWLSEAKTEYQSLKNILNTFNIYIKQKNKNMLLMFHSYTDGDGDLCFGDPNKQRVLFDKRSQLSTSEKKKLIKEMISILNNFINFIHDYGFDIRDNFPSEREFLLTRVKNRIQTTSGFNGWDHTLGSIMSVLYLYGGENYGLYPAKTKKINQKWLGTLGHDYVPVLIFDLKEKPFMGHKNYYETIKNMITAMGHQAINPMIWVDEVSQLLRDNITKEISKQSKTPEYKKWIINQGKFKKIVARWHDAFLKEIKKEKYDFDLKLYNYEGEYLYITIKDDKINTLKDIKDINKRQEKHVELIIKFSEFLERKFINKDKMFAKCIYE